MDKLTAVNELHILGKRNIAGYEFTGIEGGFGEGKKAMLVKEIAAIHGKQVGHINEAINNNRKRFKDGIDIVDLKNNGFVIGLVDNGIYTQNAINKSSSVYLLSERGYAKLLKILEDDTAWNLYDQFVDGYFNMREQQLPNDPMSILKLTFDALEGQKQELQHIKSDVKDLRENAPLFAVECDEISNAVKRHGVALLGGKQSNAYRDRGLRVKVYRDIYNQLYREFGVTSHKAIKRGHLELASKIVEGYTLPIVLSEEINFVNSQLNMAEVQ
ncbi:ORF6C domain-containing protein [Bacillus sp. FDAARGOS_235]|uniref:ORF6C domain-containing protein n=1 Tax=Bacillus sp. FDAARGOS_235 TaxID=1839798 RepID=UPI0011A6973A|nr:ORF6C domain-containing protein [Bacillus sp. FDAARGOS_235]